MKTKAKKFSKKLLALFMAIVMGVTCFSGVITSYGATSATTGYTDDAVDYNNLGWAMLTDEQVATALLDYLDDELLPQLGAMEDNIGYMLANMRSLDPLQFTWNSSTNALKIKAIGITLMTVTLKLGSVDGIMETLESVNKQLGGTLANIAGSVVDLGDILSLSLGSTKGMRRSTTSSTDIIRGVVGLIYENQTIINKLLQGTFTLGKTIGIDLYAKIGELLGMDAGYQSNLIYNVVRQLIFNYTKWYTEDEIIAFKGGRPEGTVDADGNPLEPIEAKTFIFDNELLDKMTTELLDKISVLVTYNQQYDKLATDESGKPIPKVDEQGNPDGYKYDSTIDSSATRYLKIKAKMDSYGSDVKDKYQAACRALGYDPNICYSDEFVDSDGNYLNVLLFAYGGADPDTGLATAETQKIKLEPGDNLFKFGYQALKFAWKTVLKDTVKLLHVNYDVNRGHGSNFDNEFYYYLDSNGQWTGDATKDYTMANLKAYAEHYVWADVKDADGNIVMDGEYAKKEQIPLYQSYGITVDPANVNKEKNIVATKDEAVDLFISWIRNNYEYDRDVTEGSTGKWSDIDATTITNKVRYSPIADKIFNMQTGPINLYFMQLGTPKLDEFFADANYAKYPSMVAALNDALVAAVQDIFVESKNVYGTVPTLSTVGSGESFNTIGASQIESITSTLINNALDVVQYTADAIDRNILKAFYDACEANGTTAKLSEANIETAMLPLLIACIGQVNLDGKLCDLIHPRDWDACKDAEGIVFLALQEYLSYVLPDYDYNKLITRDAEGKIVASLEGTILPMARDAVAYVMQTYVPVSDGSGNAFRVENKKPGDSGYYVNGYTSNDDGTYTYNKAGANDLFTLLNSVVCYYADKYTSSKSNVYGVANGVACLLGLCDQSGNSLINTNNDLWTNFDIVVNKFLPVVGTLQGKGYNSASSYDLIWNKIVKGILDIGPNSGVTNFINQLLTIVSAEPIQTTPIVQTVYDLAEDLLNALFGPRYNGQDWVPVPERASMPADQQATPFNYAIQAPQVAGTYTTNDKGEITETFPGLIGKALYNMIEFTGQGYKGVTTYPDTLLPGIMFALVGVNSFLNFFPIYGNHTLNTADSSFAGGMVKNGAAAGTTISDTLYIKNNSTGINTVTLDGMNNYAQDQNSRYYVKVKSVVSDNSSFSAGSIPTEKISPNKKTGISVTFTPSAGDNLYKITTTYDIVDENDNVLYSNLVTTAYKFISTDYSWVDVVYPSYNGIDVSRKDDNGIHRFPENLEPANNNYKESNGFKTYRTDTIGKYTKVLGVKYGPYISVSYPEFMMINKSDPHMINSLGLRVNNSNVSGASILRSIYLYDEGTVANDFGSSVTLTYTNAKVLFDKNTGDVINRLKYDYSEDDGVTWNRNYNETDKKYYGFDASEIPEGALRRPHVAYTLEEANTNGILAAAHKDPTTNLYQYVYFKPGSGNYTYEKVLGEVSMAGPFDGSYIQIGATTVAKNASTYVAPFKYDGETDIQPGKYDVKIQFYCPGNQETTGSKTMSFYVADDASKENLKTSINNLTTVLDKYTASDFTDPSLYSTIQDGVFDALKVYGKAYNTGTYESMADQRYLAPTTVTTTSEYGDLAYLPYTTDNVNGTETVKAMPKKVYADAHKSDDGIYYFDKDCTMPIYTSTPLTDSFVDQGTDPAGMPVIKGADGKWHLANDVVYEQQWYLPAETGLTYPVQGKKIVTDTEGNYVTDENGSYVYQELMSGKKVVYNQVQYVYRDKNGDKCNSTDDWYCKFPATEYKLYPFSLEDINEYRGCYTGAADNLRYLEEQVYENLHANQADVLFTNITQFRNGLNENNFEVITFNAMRNAARRAENNFSVIIDSYRDENGNLVDKIEMRPADAADVINDLKDRGIDVTWSTNSRLSKVQVQNYLDQFNLYLPLAVERGYLGNKVEAEIQCTTGTTYDNLTVTKAKWVDQVDENGNKVKVIGTPATVTYNNVEGVTVPFGAVDENRNLVNNGETKYTEDSWNVFLAEIADSVTLAQTGNAASYATKNYYNVAAEAAQRAAAEADPTGNTPDTIYTAAVTSCYTEYKDLRRAEIALIEDIPVGGYNVTASLVVATNCSGATATPAVGAFGDYTITLTDDTDTVVAEKVFSSANGANTFTLAGVPNGTYKMTISVGHAITREDITVVVNGKDVVGGDIPMITCNYNGDEYISITDAVSVYNAITAGSNDELYNLNGDEYVSVADAVIVYNCIGEVNFTPITIE